MSASREKKIRQEVSSQEGYVDLKAQREAEEKAKNRKANALYITMAVVFVAVAALLLVLKSGILEKNATALTIEGEDYTPAQVDFFYYSAYNNMANNYGAYIGLDNTTDLNAKIPESGVALMGLEEGTDITWDAFFKQEAVDGLRQIHALYNAAVAAGHTVDEEIQGHVQENVDTIGTYAAQSGYSTKEYLTLLYGKNMTMDTFKGMLEKVFVAEHYQSDYMAENMVYTDADLEAYYAANKDAFDMGSYEYLYFSGTAVSTKDAEGNAVPVTDAEQKAAAEQAKTDAAAVLERVKAGEKLETIAKDYESASYYHAKGTTPSYGSPVDEWVYNSARKAGDSAIVESDTARYVVVFENVSRPEYKTVNVRHILAIANTDALDTTSETYEADSQKIWDAAKVKADDILNEWKSGEATAESFAALAIEKSDDGGSAANGGLYTGINKSTNFVAPFLNWCFEDSRAKGDTGVVETDYGYHVMYLDSFGNEYWKDMATTSKRNEDMSAWLEEMTESVTATEGDGMKYVG